MDTQIDLTALSTDELIEVAQLAIEQKQVAEDGYKQIRSESQKWADLLIQVVDYVSNHKGDVEKLAEIEEENPKLAKLIQEKVYGGKTSKELNSSVSEETQSSIDEIVNQLPEDLQEKFREEFTEMTEWKKITDKNFAKYVKATMWVIQDSVDLSIEQEAKIWSMGSDGKKTTSKSEDNNTRSAKQNDIAKSFDNL